MRKFLEKAVTIEKMVVFILFIPLNSMLYLHAATTLTIIEAEGGYAATLLGGITLLCLAACIVAFIFCIGCLLAATCRVRFWLQQVTSGIALFTFLFYIVYAIVVQQLIVLGK